MDTIIDDCFSENPVVLGIEPGTSRSIAKNSEKKLKYIVMENFIK
jgi:hypothetical protein